MILAVFFNALIPGFIGGSCLMLGLVVREMLRTGWAIESLLLAFFISLTSVIWVLNILPSVSPPWLAILSVVLLTGGNFNLGLILNRPPRGFQAVELYGLACLANAMVALVVQIIALRLR